MKETWSRSERFLPGQEPEPNRFCRHVWKLIASYYYLLYLYILAYTNPLHHKRFVMIIISETLSSVIYSMMCQAAKKNRINVQLY